MSKLYKKFISLKIENPNKVYLFKVGIFYIFIDDDARLMSTILNLKLTKLNSVIPKCGFPISSSKKYFDMLKKYNYDICIIEDINLYNTIPSYQNNENIKKVISKLSSVNIDNLSISETYELLYDLQKTFNLISGDDFENEEKV